MEPCIIQSNVLNNNQSLLIEINILKKAWLFCASQIDMIIECQD